MAFVAFWLECWSFVGQTAQLKRIFSSSHSPCGQDMKRHATALLVAPLGVWILQHWWQHGAVHEDQGEDEEEEDQEYEDDLVGDNEQGEWATCVACDQVRFIEDCYDPFCYGCSRGCPWYGLETNTFCLTNGVAISFSSFAGLEPGKSSACSLSIYI